MKRVLGTTVLLCLLLAGSCWAADFSLLLNDFSAQGRFNIALDKNDFGESYTEMRLLYNDHKDTQFGTIAGGVSGEPGDIPGVKFGAEVLANLGSSNDKNLMAIGLGLKVNYLPPPVPGLAVYGRLQYAPELLSFLNCKNLFEPAVGVSYMITPKAAISVEYQNIRADIKHTGHRNIDNAVRAGILFHF